MSRTDKKDMTNISEEAAKAQQKIKESASQTVQTARAKTGEWAEQAQTKAGELGDQAKDQASQFAQQAKTEAASTFDQQKNRAAHQVDNVASALRQSSQDFRTHDQEMFARYTDMAAEQMEQFSGYVRSKGFNDVLDDVRELAQRQPELFVAGTLAAGFFLGRFLKSSRHGASAYDNRKRNDSSYRQSDANRAYGDYYESRQRPYPAGEYRPVGPGATYQRAYESAQEAQYRAATGAPAQPHGERATTPHQAHEFQGGATAYNGERGLTGQYRTGTASDPAVTGADWGQEYTANEFGQTKPTHQAEYDELGKEDK
ncbi:MAG: hypothetical protein KDE54_11480 [Caldilineaceae bacterium]|nr:hypothetical protein [Caldilineaceae bacterium]MCB0095182.1 hypothetical protein [Caldilineaceae bacterium]MCB0140839.1 hypothetical protein [Caldilineaceae bacterium]